MKFKNLCLLVNDYKKCVDFYTTTLGLETEFDLGIYAGIKSGENVSGLSIFNSEEMNKTIKTNEKAVIEFEVECVDTAYKMLKEKGVEFINEPIDIPDWEMRYAYLRDPEGNLVALFAPLAESK